MVIPMKMKPILLLAIVFLTVKNFSAQQKPIVVDTTRRTIGQPEIHEITACEALNSNLGTDDFDLDRVNNCDDNCIFDKNKDQKDKDKNGVGDACEWRKREEEEWERTGRQQRLTATEPVDLVTLVARSTDIILARFDTEAGQSEPGKLGGTVLVSVVDRLKGKGSQIFQIYKGGMWVHIVDPAPKELAGTLLVFLKNGKVRAWKRPHVFSAQMYNGQPYVETYYFGFDLVDPKYGVLGVSPERLVRLKEIIASEKTNPKPTTAQRPD